MAFTGFWLFIKILVISAPLGLMLLVISRHFWKCNSIDGQTSWFYFGQFRLLFQIIQQDHQLCRRYFLLVFAGKNNKLTFFCRK